jgi:chromosome partitioning protein
LLPAIPLSVKSAESAAERTSVLHYMPRSPVAVAYRQAGDWLERGGPAPLIVPVATAEGLHV